MDTLLTPEEYELHLKQLRERLESHLDRGEGKRRELMDEAEKVLALQEQFPEVYAQYVDVEGLVADLLARKQQAKFISQPVSEQSPGCLLGWILSRRRSHPGT